jgi:hypothetical protein
MDPATLQREVAEYLGATADRDALTVHQASGTDPQHSAAAAGEGSSRGNPIAAAAAGQGEETKGRRSGDAARRSGDTRRSGDNRAARRSASIDKGGAAADRRPHSLDSTGAWGGVKGLSKQPGDDQKAGNWWPRCPYKVRGRAVGVLQVWVP